MPDTWHPAKSAPVPGCLHCEESASGGHYHCTEDTPCQDCTDDGLSAAEDIAAGYGPEILDEDPRERDTDLEHPWNLHA